MALPIVWFPSEWNFSNYAEVLEKLDFITYYKNTIIYTAVVLFGQLFLCSLAGYSFARLNFRFKNVIFFLILAVLMVPPQMTLIPRYQMMNYLGWVDTYKGLIIPIIPSAYGTFFLRQFFMTLPGNWRTPPRSTAAPTSGSTGTSCCPCAPVPWWPTASSLPLPPGTIFCGR